MANVYCKGKARKTELYETMYTISASINIYKDGELFIIVDGETGEVLKTFPITKEGKMIDICYKAGFRF